ncbi:hypothetical protein GCM10011581_46180 [Saccharopolyspora subtropica]|uniref:Uncharacterized protein n=1 Tax=Saccharopolyspora thermophila TaxID=89367 RepID=A0A917KA15_9PSEU|nr:hypothetical protein [Saccharopolyspora subtropica]GGJ03938.1 hypothetical protein GCM10011581_46180 [Saccharopolyspora subtropica]
MSSIEDVKAALLQVPEAILAVGTAANAVTAAYEQAYVTVSSLMTGSNNPNVAALLEELNANKQAAFALEGGEDRVRTLIRNLIATF